MQQSHSSEMKHNQNIMSSNKDQQSSSSIKTTVLSNTLNSILPDGLRRNSTERQSSKKRTSKQSQQIASPTGISLRNSMKFASKRMAQVQEKQVPISIQFSPSFPQLSSPSLKMRGGAATTTTTVATPTTATTEASMKGSISMMKQLSQQNVSSNTIHSKILSFLDKKTSAYQLQKIAKLQHKDNRNNSGSRVGTASPDENRPSWSNSNNTSNTFQHQNNFDKHHHFFQHPQSASTNNLSCLNKPVVWFQDNNQTSNRCILNSSCTAAMNSCLNNQSSSNIYDQVTRSSSNQNNNYNTQAPKHHYLSESQLKHGINGNIGGFKSDKLQQQHIETSLKRQVSPSQNSQYSRIEGIIYHPKPSLNLGFSRQKIKSRKNRKNRKTNSMTMCTTQESQDSFFENILSSGKKTFVYSPQTRDINPKQEIPLVNQFKGKMNPQKKIITQIQTSPQNNNLENDSLQGKVANITFYPADGSSGQIKEDEMSNCYNNSLSNFEILEESKSNKKNKKNKDERYKNRSSKTQTKQSASERNIQRILLAQSQDSILLPSFQRNQQSQTHLSMSPQQKEQSVPNSNSFIHSIEEITPLHIHPPFQNIQTKQRMSSRPQQEDKDTHISYPSQDQEINQLTQSDIDSALISFRNLLSNGQQENPISIHTSQSNRDSYSPQQIYLHNFPRLSNALTQQQYCQYEEILAIGIETHQMTNDFGKLMMQFAERFIKPVPKIVKSTQQLVTQSMRKDEEIKKLNEKVQLLNKENDKGNSNNQNSKNSHGKEIIHTPSTQIDETPQVKYKQIQEVGFSEQNQVQFLQAELDKQTAVIAAMQEREKITKQFLEQLQKIGYLQPQQTQNNQENTFSSQMVQHLEQNKQQHSKDQQIIIESPSNQFSAPSNIQTEQNEEHSQEIVQINTQMSDRSDAIKDQEKKQEIVMQAQGGQEQQQMKNSQKITSQKSSLKPSQNSSVLEQSAQQKQQQYDNEDEEDEELADLEIQFQIQQMNNQLQQQQAKNQTIQTMSQINLSDNLKQKLKLDLSSLKTNVKSNTNPSLVPPLGLPQVQQQPAAAMDYYDEFMSRIDEFSRSWRMAVIEEQQKYLSRDNQNNKQSKQP